MSYMSDVKVVLPLKEWEQIKREIEDNKEFQSEYLFEKDRFLAKAIERLGIRPDMVLVTWNYIKWDEPTDEVIYYFLNKLRNCGCPYKFVRVR